MMIFIKFEQNRTRFKLTISYSVTPKDLTIKKQYNVKTFNYK